MAEFPDVTSGVIGTEDGVTAQGKAVRTTDGTLL